MLADRINSILAEEYSGLSPIKNYYNSLIDDHRKNALEIISEQLSRCHGFSYTIEKHVEPLYILGKASSVGYTGGNITMTLNFTYA